MQHTQQNTQPKRRVLLVESGPEWQAILADVLTEDTTEIRSAATYQEAVAALSQRTVDLAIIDLTLVTADPATEANKDHVPNALHTLIDLARSHPTLRLIAVSPTLSPQILYTMPGVPPTLALVEKVQWNYPGFRRLIDAILVGKPWETPSSKAITQTAPQVNLGAAASANPKSDRDPTLPQPTGLTGPLHTGLMPPAVGSRPGKPRVLIIEDEASWQEIIAQLMETAGYFWRVAPDQQHAMERLRLESFHLVLLDLMLGDRDVPLREGRGWQLLDYLVSNCPKTKVIVVTDHASSTDVAKLFMGYPIKGFVDKRAFSATELNEIVREQIAGPLLRIQTLGDFRIRRDGMLVNDFGHELTETVIKILLTRRGESIAVDELVEYLWPGSDPKDHYTTLGLIIGSARTALEPDLPRSSDSKFILRSGANYTFNMMSVEMDAEQLRQLVSESRQDERRGDLDQALRHYTAARDVYRGTYLPRDRFARWAMQERGALQTLYTEALNRMADLHAEQHHLDLAIEAASEALQIDAYNESTYRRLMRYHACLNNKAAALATYKALTTLFSEFFKEEPSAETIQLQEAISADRPVDCVGERTNEHRLTPDR